MIAFLIRWSDQALWRSWLMHTVLALPMLWLAGHRAVVVHYALREMEQLLHAQAQRKFEKWYDYPLDVVFPALAALVWWHFKLPVLISW